MNDINPRGPSRKIRLRAMTRVDFADDRIVTRLVDEKHELIAKSAPENSQYNTQQ